MLCLYREAKDLELSLKLDDLHLFVELKVAMDSAHATVKELIEVDPALLGTDSHFEYLLFQLTFLHFSHVFGCVRGHLKANWVWQVLEEFNQLPLFHLSAVEAIGSLYPDLVENVKVRSKNLDRIVLSHIVSFELLNNNQNEEVKHDMGDDQNEHDVVGRCERSSTSLTFNTVRWGVHAIVHELIPIFSSSDGE